MAKPIEPTPTLYGKDAERFVKRMIKEETNPDPKRIATIKRALSKTFKVEHEINGKRYYFFI